MNILMRIIITLFIAQNISACAGGDVDKLKTSIIKNALDPDSVQFRDILINNDSNISCVIWNAKNRFGGYGDYQYTAFKKSEESIWLVTHSNISKDKCTKYHFDLINEFSSMYQDVMNINNHGKSMITRIQGDFAEAGKYPLLLDEKSMKKIIKRALPYINVSNN